VLRTYVRLAVAATPAALLGWGLSRVAHGALGTGRGVSALVLVLGGGLVVVVFVGLCRVLRITELAEVAAPLLRRIRRA
jgi:putative peptidoglycan lipid II flippase